MKKKITTRDLILLLIVVMLLFIAGISNFLATGAFSNLDVNVTHAVIFIIFGIIYMFESLILFINSLFCRNNLIILICIFISFISLIVGSYRVIDLKQYNDKFDYFIYYPLISDLIIIPILIYNYYKSKAPITEKEVALLKNNNNQIIAPIYLENGTENSMLNDLNYTQIDMDTANIDIGEDGDDCHSMYGTLSGNKKDEDDEKADVLVMDTPGGDHGIGEVTTNEK